MKLILLFVLWAAMQVAAYGASSEAIARPNPRQQECTERLVDQVYIGNMLRRGRTAEELKATAQKSSERLGEERLEKVLALIDEAYAAQEKGKLQAWFDGYWNACLTGKEI